MPTPAQSSQSILRKKVEEFLSQGKEKFYLHEIAKESKVTINEAEEFFMPLLRKNHVEGVIELRCPNCGGHLGTFKKYNEVPANVQCELCDYEFHLADEYLNIVLEVKGKFFRAQKSISILDKKKTHKIRDRKIITGCNQ